MIATLDALAERISELEDKEEIRALKARYLRSIDLSQHDAVRDCFHPGEVRIAYQYQNFPVFTNREDFIAFIQKTGGQPGVYNFHHATNWEIRLTGRATANGCWSLVFQSIQAGPRLIIRLALEYMDKYRKEDGRWWIVESLTRNVSLLIERVTDDGRVIVQTLGDPTTA